jgi:uncharacterized protein YjiS (DUF1127 family)
MQWRHDATTLWGARAMNTAAFADTKPAQWRAHADAIPATNWLGDASNLLTRWLDASRSRQTLDELDDHLLRDIGLTREQAHHESRKFFWQA